MFIDFLQSCPFGLYVQQQDSCLLHQFCFDILKNSLSIFHGNYTNLHPYQQCLRGTFSIYPHSFPDDSHPHQGEMIPVIVIHISMMVSDSEHFFTCVASIYQHFKMSTQGFCPSLLAAQFLEFLIYSGYQPLDSCMICRYILSFCALSFHFLLVLQQFDAMYLLCFHLPCFSGRETPFCPSAQTLAIPIP